MRTKPQSCVGCACYSHGTDFSAIEGTGSSGVMLVGEASGEMEAREGTPFVRYAPAGSVLERVIRRMGLDRQQFSTTNVLRCRPRNNWLENAPWEFAALAHCRPNLEAAIASRRPRAIVALGGTALRELTGLAGKQLGVGHLAGYVLRGPQDIPVIPNFHPAYLRRGKASHQGIFARILQRALNIATHKDVGYVWNVDPANHRLPLDYQTHPSETDALSFLYKVQSQCGLCIAMDIETSESTDLDEDAREGFKDTYVQQIQFSDLCGHGIVFPWQDPYRQIALDILATPNVKYGHNWNLFDHKVLRAAASRDGFEYRLGGPIYDTLDMFHHWQPDLPAHLQFAAQFVQFPFPWKHLAASNIAFYGACDVDATWRLGETLVATLKRDRLWDGYIGQVYEVRPILAAMEDRGMPIDNDERLALGAKFEAAQKELGDQISAEAGPLGRIQPKDGYKGVPPQLREYLTGLYGPLNKEKLTEYAELNVHIPTHRYKEDDRAKPDGEVELGEWYHYETREFDEAVMDDMGNPTTRKVTRWCRVYDFNPNSRLQVIAYMRAHGHPVPKDKHRENDEGENPDTTAEKELRRLAAKTGDTFYLRVVEYRGFTKLRGTYIDGFAPGPDGCVHTTFTFDTAIAQLSSRNPNVQNFTKLKPTPVLAQAMRGMVAAKPGYILTEWDYKSCHVLTLGFLAEDPQWMRLARLDMHSFVAGHLLGLWDCAQIIHETDAELMARFKWLKSDPERKRVRDDQAKHGILGIGNGLQAKGLYERYMEQFPPRPCPSCSGSGREPGARPNTTRNCRHCSGTRLQSGLSIAEDVLAICRAIGPRVFAWQKRVQREAHDKQLLRTEFGHQRRFYEVFRWDSARGDWGHGDQAEEAIAYWLSNVAHAHMRETMKAIDHAGFADAYGLFNQIHDALLFHFPEELLDQHVRDIYPLFAAPSRVLRNATAPEGLVIDCEAAWGRRWNAMTEIDLKPYRGESHVPAPIATLAS